MRKNLPVTDKIHDYPAHLTLISITDIKGRITYCNNDFIEVSGYTKEELLGQPHNLLRHPDMPEEAFRDFWETIQAGKLWSALIKNRRKNGDAYWVRANATPLRINGKIVGYLSVRTLPEAVEIEAAERLYATMRQAMARGRLSHRLRAGIPQRIGLLQAFVQALTPGRQAKALLCGLLAAAGPFGASLLGLPWWGVLVAGLVTAVLAWQGIVRAFIAPADRIVAVARHLASGDLSEFISIRRFQDIRALVLPINQLALMVRTVIWDVRQFLSNDANEVAEHSQDMVKRAEQQAAVQQAITDARFHRGSSLGRRTHQKRQMRSTKARCISESAWLP